MGSEMCIRDSLFPLPPRVKANESLFGFLPTRVVQTAGDQEVIDVNAENPNQFFAVVQQEWALVELVHAPSECREIPMDSFVPGSRRGSEAICGTQQPQNLLISHAQALPKFWHGLEKDISARFSFITLQESCLYVSHLDGELRRCSNLQDHMTSLLREGWCFSPE